MAWTDEIKAFLRTKDVSFEEKGNIIGVILPRPFDIALLESPEHHSKAEICVHKHLWISQPEQLKSRICSKLGLTKRIHGRLTEVIQITRPQAVQFLNENHLTGGTKAKTYLGLQNKNGELVAVATFSKKRSLGKGSEYKSSELIRYANRLNETVVGGLDKLLQHFIKEHRPNDIMTYVDREQSSGDAFLKLGFEKVGEREGIPYRIDPSTNRRIFPNRDQLNNHNSPSIFPHQTAGNIKLKLFISE